MVTFMKHYALNDQESNRDTNGVAVWADEQTMRENYFKVFEWAVKKGRLQRRDERLQPHRLPVDRRELRLSDPAHP